MAANRGDDLAKIIVLFLAVAALNAFRRGELGDWTKAKFLNWGDPSPAAGATTLASILGGATSAIPGTSAGVDAITAGVDDAVTAAGLVQVGTTKMSKGFAARWRPLAAHAARDGVTLSGGAWRSHAAQIQLRVKHGCGGSAINDRSCKGNPPTAVPGRSRHETGDAIDVNLTGAGGRSSPEYRWLARNASKYAVYNLPSEPWHWSIDGS